MQLTIFGRIPSKKNSKQIILRGKYPKLISSKAYREWETEQLYKLKPIKKLDNIESITLSFYFPDNRKADLTNKAESIMDLLVAAGILEDDNWKVTGSVHLIPCGVDKDNPRVDIIMK